MNSSIRVGDRVITAASLALEPGWPGRVPDARGQVIGARVGFRIDKGGLCEMLHVRHDDDTSAYYLPEELASELEQRLATIERRHEALREAMAGELHGFDQRLTALEPNEQPTGEPVANPAALAQAWKRLTQVQRDELQRWMMTEKPGYLPPYAHRLAAESALVAASGLLADIGTLRRQLTEADREIAGLRGRQEDIIRGRDIAVRELASSPPASIVQAYEGLHRVIAAAWQRLHKGKDWAWIETDLESDVSGALLTLAELGVIPGEPCPARDPDEPAPAPEAVETIEHLRQRVEELTEQRVRLLAAVAHVAGQARGIEAEDPDATSAELRRRICQALHVEPIDMTDEQIADLVTGRCQLFDRLADPEAYGIGDPDKLATAAVSAAKTGHAAVMLRDAARELLRAWEAWQESGLVCADAGLLNALDALRKTLAELPDPPDEEPAQTE